MYRQGLLLLILIVCLLLATGVMAQTPAVTGPQSSQNDSAWRTFSNANYVESLDFEGNYVWCATNGGVVRWDRTDGSYIKYTTADGLIDNWVQDVVIDASGNKWFGTHSGLIKFDGSNWTTFTGDVTSAGDVVREVAIDGTGILWIGTPNGLAKYNGTSWTPYTTADGLVDNSIHSIEVDGHNNI